MINWHYPLSWWLWGIGINTILGLVALVIPKKLLTPAGLIHSWFLGVIIWGTLGLPGYGVVMFYFLVGSAVTKIGSKNKEDAGIAEGREGARGPENVWGSAATGAICALLTLVSSGGILSLLHLSYVASLSTKLSDTTASEIGKAYGKRTFLITTLEPVARGTEGAVSLEGTVAGIGASAVIAGVGWSLGMIEGWGFFCCVIAALIATTIESLIGATWQSKLPWLTNELVNFINTLIGAIAAASLALVLTPLMK